MVVDHICSGAILVLGVVFFRGRVFACKDGRGLFRLDFAHCGMWEYSLPTKASPCQFFCCGGEEGARGGLCVRFVLFVVPLFLSPLLFVSAALELLFLSSSPHWPFNCRELPSR